MASIGHAPCGEKAVGAACPAPFRALRRKEPCAVDVNRIRPASWLPRLERRRVAGRSAAPAARQERPRLGERAL
ncbi:MAG: hypothetical protein V8Q84_05560 [Bilophila sp.]